MKKLIYIATVLMLFITIIPANTYGGIAVEKEVKIESGNDSGKSESQNSGIVTEDSVQINSQNINKPAQSEPVQPPQPAQSEQPAPSPQPAQPDPPQPAQPKQETQKKKPAKPETSKEQEVSAKQEVSAETETPTEPEKPVEKKKNKKKKKTQIKKEEFTESTEVLIEPETEKVEAESEIIVPETEPKTEPETETESIKITEKEEKQSIEITELEKILGIVFILIAITIFWYLMYGHVKLYNLSTNNKYSYVGRCRIAKSKGNIRIYISKFVLERGKTNEFKIVISKRLLKTKKNPSVYLVFPENQKQEVGLRKEIQFQYE